VHDPMSGVRPNSYLTYTGQLDAITALWLASAPHARWCTASRRYVLPAGSPWGLFADLTDFEQTGCTWLDGGARPPLAASELVLLADALRAYAERPQQSARLAVQLARSEVAGVDLRHARSVVR
jgi:hypothetical protein